MSQSASMSVIVISLSCEPECFIDVVNSCDINNYLDVNVASCGNKAVVITFTVLMQILRRSWKVAVCNEKKPR